MLRTLLYFAGLAVLIFVAYQLASWNGRVAFNLPAYEFDLIFITLPWPGYHIDASLGVLLGAVLVLTAMVTVVYRFWSMLKRSPGALGRKLGDSRRRSLEPGSNSATATVLRFVRSVGDGRW